MQEATPIDVRGMAPGDRHPLIFGSLLALEPGEHLEVLNDHDPKPLSYLLAAEYPGRFTFAYIATGPVDWQVRIGRTEEPAG
ncbi:MAG: DUF2249 domain-containing protein [Chloroflexota bacterium]